MAQLSIRDFQVVERADITLDGQGGIVLVAGRNSQGKSSVAKGAAAVMTGQVQLGGIPKKEGKRLVRDGRESASATFKTDTSTARATWPKCEYVTEGPKIGIGTIAAGLDNVVDMPVKERANLLAGLLRTAPAREDFDQACADADIPGNIAAKLWADLEALGWDGKLKDVQEKGAKFKAKWELVTGEAYGPVKAKTWFPQDWTDDLADASLDDLHAEVGEAKLELERAIAGRAVDQAEIDRLTAACANLQELEAASLDAQTAATQAEATHKEAQRHRDSLPPGEQPHALTCPSCKAHLQVKGPAHAQELIPAATIPDAELQKRRMDIASADGKLSNAKGKLDEANRNADGAQRALQAAQEAKRKLDAMESDGSTEAAGDGAQEARDRLALAEQRHKALQTKHDADQIRDALIVNAAVQTILAPDGLRQSKLIKVLDTFNDGPLAELCGAAGFAPVRIEPDMSITYGGRPYPLLAGLGPQLSSDQFRVRVVLQVALAQRKGDGLVIIDAADVLDQGGRNGLIKLLRGAGLDALVCMTFSKPDLVPDLEKAGMGRAYWIEDGVAMPLADAKAKADQKEAA